MVLTERLELLPLTVAQLELCARDMAALTREMDCVYKGQAVSGFFRDFIDGQVVKAKNDEENYIFHSIWFIIRVEDRAVVGSAGFKGAPVNGEVEIGYGLGADFEGSGYMAEAVQGICGWAGQNGISCVTARTENGNAKSENVLARCGFAVFGQDDLNKNWRKDT